MIYSPFQRMNLIIFFSSTKLEFDLNMLSEYKNILFHHIQVRENNLFFTKVYVIIYCQFIETLSIHSLTKAPIFSTSISKSAGYTGSPITTLQVPFLK